MPTKLLALAIAVLLLAGCNFNAVHGSGNIVTEARNVAGFRSIELSGTGHLLIEQNGTEGLTITAEDNLLPLLTAEVEDGRLKLAIKPMTNIDPTRDIVYKVSARELDGIEVSGFAAVDGNGIQSKDFRVSVSGAGKIVLAGNAERQQVELSGAASYNGEGLRTRESKVSISGAATATVAVRDRLDAEISGAGSVRYIGDPQVSQQVSGAGSVRKMD